MLFTILDIIIFSCFAACLLGSAIKRSMCSDIAVSSEEDTFLQDEAQLGYLRHRSV